MVADDTEIIKLIANDLDIAGVIFGPVFVELPFEWLEANMVARDVLGAKLGLCFFFRVADAAVLEW